jgi:predicted RNA-binding protein YlqC (UPF0109 family)
LAYLVGLLVDNPEALELSAEEDGDGYLFKVKVAEEDLGAVIGRRGRVAMALRTVLRARAQWQGQRYSLKILDD